MSWGAPGILWTLLLLVGVIVLLVVRGTLWRRGLARQVDPALWERLTGGGDRAGRRWQDALLVLAAAACVVGAARPQFGSRIVQVKRSGIDVLVALDASASMEAADVVPNRMARSRREIADMIERLRGDRIGIVVYEGEAFLLCPLTLDYAAARLFLDAAETRMLPTPGSNLAEAIRSCLRSFPAEGNRSRAIVVFSDGESHDADVLAAVEEARRAEVRIFTVGVGTPAGQPIPERDDGGSVTGYKKDRGGQVILSRLDEGMLRRVAEETGGRYYPATLAGAEIEAIYSELADMEQAELTAGLRSRHEERFQLLAGLAALCLMAMIGWPRTTRRREWTGRV